MGIVEWSCKISLQERADCQTPYRTRCGCTQYGLSSRSKVAWVPTVGTHTARLARGPMTGALALTGLASELLVELGTGELDFDQSHQIECYLSTSASSHLSRSLAIWQNGWVCMICCCCKRYSLYL